MSLMPDWVQTLRVPAVPVDVRVPDRGARRPMNAGAARRPRHQLVLDPRRVGSFCAESGGARSGTTRRWATERATLRVALLPARRRDERAAVPGELLPPAVAVAAGARRPASSCWRWCSRTRRAQRLERPELLVVLGVFTILMGGVIRAVDPADMMQLIEDVQRGKLDFVLTKPVDAQLLVSVRAVEIWQAVDIVVGRSSSSSRSATRPRPGRARGRWLRLRSCSAPCFSTASG